MRIGDVSPTFCAKPFEAELKSLPESGQALLRLRPARVAYRRCPVRWVLPGDAAILGPRQGGQRHILEDSRSGEAIRPRHSVFGNADSEIILPFPDKLCVTSFG